MEAIVLAGGLGTRLRPLTYARPKPLLPLLGTPLIDHVLRAIPDAFDTVIIPLNHLPDQLRAHFREHPDPRVVLVDEPEPLGTGGAVKNVEHHVTGPFLIVNADIVSSIELSAMLDAHRRHRATVTLSLWPVDEPWHFGVARLGHRERIVAFVEKPPRGQEPTNLANAGHYLCEPEVLDHIPSDRFVSLEREVFEPLVAEGAPVHGFRFDGYWVDSGRPESYREAHRLALGHLGLERRAGRDARGIDQADFRSLALGDRVRLGRGARVVGSVLLDDVEVGAGAVVRDSVLGSGVRVGAGTRLEDCVVADGLVLPSQAAFARERLGLRPEDRLPSEGRVEVVG